jgi:hypothetical protein
VQHARVVVLVLVLVLVVVVVVGGWVGGGVEHCDVEAMYVPR